MSNKYLEKVALDIQKYQKKPEIKNYISQSKAIKYGAAATALGSAVSGTIGYHLGKEKKKDKEYKDD